MKKRSCFCLGELRERDIDDVKNIVKKIMKEYRTRVDCEEVVVGYEDLPVYREDGQRVVYDGRYIRFYYLDHA